MIMFRIYGSMKGSLDTYWEKEGNDYDLASLLIALLRASNIPARYVRAKIIVPVEQIQALTGINDAMTAVKYLGSSKIVLGYYTTGGKISHVYLEHVYVEANVPYANYRGTMEDTAGKIWIQLDPSFKQYQTVQDGIDLATDMGFDWKTFSNQYIGDLRTNTPMEYYKEQMDAFIAGKYPGQTLDNLKHIAAIKTMQFDFLPNTVPYNIIELIERTSQLAAAQRHTIRFNIPDCLDYQTTLPDIAGRRVTLSYIGATADDQTLIDQYGGIYKTPPYLISVKPELRIGGIKVAEGTAMQAAISSPLNVYYTAAGEDTVDFDHTIITGSYNAIGITVGKVRPEYLSIAEVEKSDDAYLAKLLHSIAMGYHDRGNQTTQLLNDTMKMKGMTSFAEALVTTMEDRKMSIWDIPTDFEFNGFTIDAKDMTKAALPIDGGVYQKKMLDYAMVHGHEDSYQENRVFEDNLFWISGLSAVKGLQYLNAMGINIIELEPNQTYVNPNLPDYIISRINDALHMGLKVIVPEETGGLTVIPYIKYDPNTGSAGYMIVTLAGGYLPMIYWNIWPDPSANPKETLFESKIFKSYYQRISPTEDGNVVAMGDSFNLEYNIILEIDAGGYVGTITKAIGMGVRIDTDITKYPPPMIAPSYALKAGWYDITDIEYKKVIHKFFVWGVNIIEGSGGLIGMSQNTDGKATSSNSVNIAWETMLKEGQTLDDLTLKIKDSSGNIVKTMSGLQLKGTVSWDGITDKGTMYADEYTATLYATSGGRTVESKTKCKITVFEVDITTPTATAMNITAAPAMPNVTFNATVQPASIMSSVTFKWYLNMFYMEHGRNDHHRVPLSGMDNISGNGNWTPNWGDVFAGGDIVVHVVAAIGDKEATSSKSSYQIKGDNPNTGDVNNRLGGFPATKIACWESRHRLAQFDNDHWPLFCGCPLGWGIMQIDTPPAGCPLTERVIWNWHDNVDTGLCVIADKRRLQTNYINKMYKKYPDADRFPSSVTINGVAYDATTIDVIKRYNSGFYYRLDEERGVWLNVNNIEGDSTYVGNVLSAVCN